MAKSISVSTLDCLHKKMMSGCRSTLGPARSRGTSSHLDLTSLEDLWDKRYLKLDQCDMGMSNFTRKSTMTNPCLAHYVETEINARDSINRMPVSDESTAASSGAPELSDYDYHDIFGFCNVAAGKAYLMPRARWEKSWYIAIPWILPNAKSGDPREPEAEYLDRMYRYVNGSRKNGIPNGKAQSGIKHFLSNRIILTSHDVSFEYNPYILIIPILSVDQSRDWNGEGYDAVFLAASYGRFPAYLVYTRSLANYIIDRDIESDTDFATPEEIDTARNLLSCVLQTLSVSRCDRTDSANACLPDFSAENGVPVPMAKDGNAVFRVRKVTFDDVQQSKGGNPAPDPTLLVLKAAESWTRLCSFPLLRPYGEQSERSNSEYSTDVTMSSDEIVLSEDFCEAPPVQEVVFDRQDWLFKEELEDNQHDL
jgi:hypothetical protein